MSKFPELTWREWQHLNLVNEKVQVTKETVCHTIYGSQTAVHRSEEILDKLWELGLLTNRGHFYDYKYITTELGDEYIETALKPTPPIK